MKQRSTPARPPFPVVDPERLSTQIQQLPAFGRPIPFKRAHACTICRRTIGPLGWLLAVGAPSCPDEACQVLRPGDISKLFPTPYGRALSRSTLSLFARPYELPSGALVLLRAPIVERASALAHAYARLIRWQEIYDAWEWFQDPEGYSRGLHRLIPPKRLDEVLVIRSVQELLPKDPLVQLDDDTQALLRRAYREGTSVFSTPF